MLSWGRTLDVASIPLLFLSLYVCANFAQKRRKRGYRVVRVGTLFITAAIGLRIFLQEAALEPDHWNGIIQRMIRSFDVSGRYLAVIGLILLHRMIPKRGRWILYGSTILFLSFGVLPSWLSALIAGFLGLGSIFFAQKWIGFSNRMFQFLFVLFAIKDLGAFGGWLLNDKYQGDMELTSAFACVGSIFLMLGIVISRVSDVLDTSYQSSITDALTGLYNRRYFTGWVNKYVERGMPVSVIFFDLDHFKNVNDTLGHEKGDEALKVVAEILKEEVDGRGIAGRYGGEEMVVLVTKEETHMEGFCERIRARIESECITTASIGFSTVVRGITADELIKQADEAMYYAKNNGRNRVIGY